MLLTAIIHDVTIGADDQQQIHFSLFDDESTAQVSFMDTIGLAHATFLIENSIVATDTAYGKMLAYFIENYDGVTTLTGKEFTSGDEPEHDPADCEQGTHSWCNEVGLLPPDTRCTACNAEYGYPD